MIIKTFKILKSSKPQNPEQPLKHSTTSDLNNIQNPKNFTIFSILKTHKNFKLYTSSITNSKHICALERFVICLYWFAVYAILSCDFKVDFVSRFLFKNLELHFVINFKK